MEALYQSLDPTKVRFFSCDFWSGSDAQCDAFQNLVGSSNPVLLNAHVLGAPNQYNCSYHYVFVIDGDGLVAYRGTWNANAISLVVADAVSRLETQVGVDDLPGASPLLGAIYPNPFNPTASVPYLVPERLGAANVRLDVLDVRGRVVRTLVDGIRAAGSHLARFDGRDDDGNVLPSGSYLARLQVAGLQSTRIMTLLK
ncbi:MAG: FlgD immunoglobulin-like domain containing protein [Candidatus Krumholzibacteriia bacterium]